MRGKSAQTRVGLTKTDVETYRDEISKNGKHRSIEKCFLYNICTANLFISPKSKQILAVQVKTCFLCAHLPLLTLPKNNILCFFIDVYSPFLSRFILSVAYFFMYNLVGYLVDSFRRLYIPLSMNLVGCFAIFYVYIQFRISDYWINHHPYYPLNWFEYWINENLFNTKWIMNQTMFFIFTF
jgi:hypothetical protein